MATGDLRVISTAQRALVSKQTIGLWTNIQTDGEIPSQVRNVHIERDRESLFLFLFEMDRKIFFITK